MNLTERFLRAKHWQLFLLTFGIPMIMQFVLMGVMFANIGSGDPPEPIMITRFFSVYPLITLIFIATFFGWFWSVGVGLQRKVPANVKMKTGKFKIFFFIPIVYLFFFIAGWWLLMTNLVDGMDGGDQANPDIIFGSMAIIFPLHIFAMFCIFYCLYFVSKTFKTVELQRETTFADFAGEFFMLWFYPVGIWIIQPKINKMVEDTSGAGVVNANN